MRVSIIIPVFNSEKTLERCIDSLLEQSYRHLEIVLVNDGSTDNSGNICDKYSKKHNNILAFHQPNNGVSAARNLGLDNCNGDWVCFVDSDDYVGKNYVESFLLTNLEETELVVQDIVKIERGDRQRTNVGLYGTFEMLDIAYWIQFNAILKNGYAACKLYCKKTIDRYGLRFDQEVRFCEDLIFYLKFLSSIEKVSFVDEGNYFYEITRESATSKIFPFEEYMLTIEKLDSALAKYHESILETEQYKFLFGLLTYLALLSVFKDTNGRSSNDSIVMKLSALRECNKFMYLSYYVGLRKTAIIENFFVAMISKKKFSVVRVVFPLYMSFLEFARKIRRF
ncbi:glycosyltransferase family 2 protein [Sphingobacterium sp. UT-1RO-CII-1]|uniref:glycosyltransferase family 2 protein n=1 Tax=Sphingobacterium sp. UT-1RO-CII-1 TaxID=2995225 RepID=UPI00227CE885|nr:glycosyltransferase family 2 protein [Sphingobacterium sp. UT-1RO-CII-1]MCY4780801.1 glycosyltransferase family 2 protein [Sphingobacterium sp. UT-1RO-CII-1]